MQRSSVGHNPNPVEINFVAFCVGKSHLSHHQNRYFLRLLYVILVLALIFSVLALYIALFKCNGKCVFLIIIISLLAGMQEAVFVNKLSWVCPGQG